MVRVSALLRSNYYTLMDPGSKLPLTTIFEFSEFSLQVHSCQHVCVFMTITPISKKLWLMQY